MEVKKQNDAIIISNYKIQSAKAVVVDIEYKNNNFDGCKVYYYKGKNNAVEFLYDAQARDFVAFSSDRNILADAESAELQNICNMFCNACDNLTVKEWARNDIIYKITHNNLQQVVSIELSTQKVIDDLTTLLFNKYIVKYNYIKNIQYSYNYTDKQKLTAIYDNKYRDTFYNIPTTMGALTLYKIK